MGKCEKKNKEMELSTLESKSMCDYSAYKKFQGRNKHTSVRIQRLLKNNYSTVFYEEKENSKLFAPKKQFYISNGSEINFNFAEANSKQVLKEIPIRKYRKTKTKLKSNLVFDKTFLQKKSEGFEDSPITEVQIKVESREFLQNDFCFKVAPELPNCSECLPNLNTSKKIQQYSYCSFINYRKLFISENGRISHSGFLEPSDSTPEDRQIWLPQPDTPPKSLTVEASDKILRYLENLFNTFIKKEEEGVDLHTGSVKHVTWKKLIQSTEESCNVCTSLIFNVHWICPECAICICIDCYKAVKEELKKVESARNYFSLLCHNCESHKLETLLLTQMIPDNVLQTIYRMMKKVCKLRKISALPAEETLDNAWLPARKRLMKNPFISKYTRGKICKFNGKHTSSSAKADHSNGSTCFENFVDDVYDIDCLSSELFSSTLGLEPSYESDDEDTITQENVSIEYIANHFKNLNTNSKSKKKELPETLNCFHMGYSKIEKPKDLLTHVHTVIGSSQFVQNIPHTWLNNGKLLLLHEPNIKLFQQQWKQSQVAIVSGIHKDIVTDFWHPRRLCKVVDNVRNTILNCKTGQVICKLSVKKYWKGFEYIQERARDATQHYILLKLKDWPHAESFEEMLPHHFENMMKALPMPEYTAPEGIFNLAARLPTCYVQPEFGLKLESGYSLALDSDCSTTNLHLNVADTVNVLVHASLPQDGNHELYLEAIVQEVDESGCDSITKQRFLDEETALGALWDIYDVSDANKIRAFLFKIATERGVKLKAYDDPLQNNNWYLNKILKKRLSDECCIKGCIIIQHIGDAIFIPAGVPYQVRNLRDCVNVTKKFISPESMSNSLKLVQESRTLINLHSSLKQELAVNLITYHAVKDALSCLLHTTNDQFQKGPMIDV